MSGKKKERKTAKNLETLKEKKDKPKVG